MVDPHKHCPVCSIPIPLEETTCSTKCQDSLETKKVQIKKGRIILYIVMLVLLILFAYMIFFNT